MQYLERVRLDRAAGQLHFTANSVSKIALSPVIVMPITSATVSTVTAASRRVIFANRARRLLTEKLAKR